MRGTFQRSARCSPLTGIAQSERRPARAAALTARFAAGFDYIGDSRADQPVWAAATGRTSVSSHHSGGRQPAGTTSTAPDTRLDPAAAECATGVRECSSSLSRAAPLIGGTMPPPWRVWCSAAFAAFCRVCSALDAWSTTCIDLAADQTHATKRHRRPLAAGELSLAAATSVSPHCSCSRRTRASPPLAGHCRRCVSVVGGCGVC